MEVKIFLGAVEVAELEERKFLLKNIHHLRDAYPLTASHGLEIEIRIDVEVSHLDKIEIRILDQFYQSFHFCLSIREPWEYEKINRSIDPFSLRHNQGMHYCPE
jgi:hypothetical protein